MATPLIITILVKKYAKLLGELEFADRSIMDTGAGLAAFDEAVFQVGRHKREIEEKLAAVETVIWMFDANWDPSAIKPNFPRKQHLKPGIISRSAFAVLRDAKGEMTTREIAKAVASRLGYDTSDGRHATRLASTIQLTLERQLGVTVQIVSRDPLKWALIPRDQVRPRTRVQQRAQAA